jgi:hypothetical protein
MLGGTSRETWCSEFALQSSKSTRCRSQPNANSPLQSRIFAASFASLWYARRRGSYIANRSEFSTPSNAAVRLDSPVPARPAGRGQQPFVPFQVSILWEPITKDVTIELGK